ncbi:MULTISPECIES: hypothetical protein [Amycolatopsis]|uniref:hypothetical protein n=1 Tax=Amycolatopsis TaxID=1813 RepID=UPI0033AD7FD5
MWTVLVAQLVLALTLGLIGWWGRRNAPALARQGANRDHRIAVLRRGALACQVVALLFALAVVPGLF